MRENMNLRKAPLLIGIIFISLLLSGCPIQLVADYDAEIAKEIVHVSKQVDTFYGELLETDYPDRSYDAFKSQYISNEVNLRALVIQNNARPLNDESISIAETTLKLWIKYKNKHKENWEKYSHPASGGETIEAKNIYSDTMAQNHRKRFTKLFTAMSIAERVKEMKAASGNGEAP